MTAAGARKAGLMAAVMQNLPLKILSLSLSVVLFSIVHSDQDAQRTLFIDVVALLPPPDADKMLLSELPHEVKVTLRGSRARINALQRDDFQPIQMDLTDTSRRFFYFEPSSVDVGGNVAVASIQPATVVLDWADSGERKVPVKVRLDGQVAPGYEVEEPVAVQPSVVTIRGPQATLNSVTAVYTDVVSVEGLLAGEHQRRVPLEPLPPHTTYRDDVSARVVLLVRPKLVERTFRRVPVTAIGEGQSTLRPPVVTLTVRGAAERIDHMDAEELAPYVDVPEDAGTGARSASVQLRGPIEGLEVVSVSPASVLVIPRR